MKAVHVAVMCVALALLAGCQSDNTIDPAAADLGQAGPIVRRSLEAAGGRRPMHEVAAVSADVALTVHPESGAVYLLPHRLEADLLSSRLKASGRTPMGRWQAVVDPQGRYRLLSYGLSKVDMERELLGKVLGLVLHRLRGPVNLLDVDRPLRAARALVGGVAVIRVGVEGRPEQAMAYYFDAGSGLLRFITTGADQPGGEGTVTIYEYSRMADGRMFPHRLRAVKIGRLVLIGDEPVWEADLSNVSLRYSRP